jgi:hypothetical protein
MSLERLEQSPREHWLEACRRGQLAYQVDANGRAVFHPRVVAPGGGGPLEWRVSRGRGTVYAATTVHPRGGETYNVSLVDLDEGFRMMSRVEGVAPEEVRIGMTVQVHFVEQADGEALLPVFVPAVAEGGRS